LYQQFECGRLAGAIGPKPEDLARPDLEGQVIERAVAACAKPTA
jgi:hypothetical protein